MYIDAVVKMQTNNGSGATMMEVLLREQLKAAEEAIRAINNQAWSELKRLETRNKEQHEEIEYLRKENITLTNKLLANDIPPLDPPKTKRAKS